MGNPGAVPGFINLHVIHNLEADVPWPVQVQSQGGTVMSTDANRREAMRIIVGLAGTAAWAGGVNDADHKKLAEAYNSVAG